MRKSITRGLRLLVAGLYALALIGLTWPQTASAANLPAGYTLTPVTEGYNYPTNLAWLPDGTMLIAEKAGVVRAYKDGAVQAQPFINISSTTNDYWDRGLLGLAVDPDYATNHYVYLMRTFENGVGGYTASKVNQLVRVTINPLTNQMVSGSLVVLLGKDTAASCDNLAVTADCIPSDSPSHSVGDVVFAPDGSLFVTSGDGSSFTAVDPKALRSQNLDSLGGKMLRIDKNGKAVAGNPFHNGNPDANRSKVWAYGLRNPWRFTFKPGSTVPYIAEVGWDSWEEINVATPGSNFGWPCYEGNDPQGGYSTLGACQQLYTQVNNGQATVKGPLTAWDHSAGSAAAVGGVFVNGGEYPAALQGSYMYGDYAYAFLRTLRTDATHALAGAPAAFAEDMPGQVNVEQGPDGVIYVVSIANATNAPGTGAVYRLDYDDPTPPPPPPGGCPVGQFTAQYFNNKTVSGTPVLTRCEANPIDHNWGLAAPGTGVNTENFSTRWSGNFTFSAGSYRFDAWADDGVRIYLDGQLVLNGWFDQAYTHYQNSVNVSAGEHAVTIEFYDALEDAAVKALWTPEGVVTPPTPNDCNPGQFKAEYFNTLTPGGTAAMTRCEDAPLNHNWGLASPGTGVNAEVFSTRWTGAFTFQQGQYRFNATADDGVRIFVDGTQVLNGWFDQAATAYAATANMTAGTHTVTIEYYDKLEDAVIQAGWTQLSGNTPPAATITTPGAVSTAVMGSTVNFSGSATDAQDGAIPAANLSWSATIRHCNLGQCHSHFLQQFTGNSGSFVFPDHGQDEYYVELGLTATDSQGATNTKTVRIDPQRDGTPPPPPPTGCAANEFKAEYFNNKTLTGSPALTRCENAVDHNWGLTSPGTGVNTENFSTRWTGTFTFETANYRFDGWADDGVRIFVDGTKVLDGWKDQAYTHYQNAAAITAGQHVVTVEFYDALEDAAVKAVWTKEGGTPTPPPPGGCAPGEFTAEYFNNTTLSGTPVVTACTATVNFDWLGAPAAGVNADFFSARFTAQKALDAATYRFSITGDDGIRLYVDDALLVNGWKDQAATTYTGNKTFGTAGTHTLRLEFYDAAEDAVAKLDWIKL